MTDADFEAAYLRASQVDAYIQGEVFDLPDVCVVLADAAWPLAELSKRAAEQTGGDALVVVPEPVDRIAVLTQTCDLQVTAPETRLCQVVPVIDRGDASRTRHNADDDRDGQLCRGTRCRVSLTSRGLRRSNAAFS